MGSLYERLGEDDIRLLSVGMFGERFESLTLRTYARTAAPEYDAVSYTWGDDTSTTLVNCNGFVLQIRTNLFTALPFMHGSRPEPKTRPLWIDAICLNQDDPDEKAIQVPRMGEIYEDAARTLIWFGEAADNSDLAMDNIESLTGKLQAVENPNAFDLQQVRQLFSDYDLPPIHDQRWKAIEDLLQRPWLYRLWTLQEIVLAREAVVLCGNKSISWDILSAFNEAFDQAELDGVVNKLENRELFYKHPSNIIAGIAFLRDEKYPRPLPALLTFSLGREYKLPIDRVWALIGMLDEGFRKQIRDAKIVDYSKNAVVKYHETFLNVVKLLVQHDTTLAMEIIEGNMRTVRNPSLPSWCPDWHTDKGEVALTLWPETFVGFPSGQFRRLDPFMKVNQDWSLELCGLSVDVIDCVTSAESDHESTLDLHDFFTAPVNFDGPTADENVNFESCSWLIECLEIIDSTDFTQYDVYHDEVPTPSIPTTRSDGVPISEEVQRFIYAQEMLKYVLYPPPLEDSPLNLASCKGRKFFRTNDNRLGIGPAKLEANDLLCAMYGAQTLWALRPRKILPTRAQDSLDITGKFGQRAPVKWEFELLGNAYTPSLLSEQLWEGTSCESMRKFRLR